MMHESPQKQLIAAVNAAQAGNWDQAHAIVQELNHPTAHWIHAVLHKIEGDAWNSRYWYARCRGRSYEQFSSIAQEWQAILDQLMAD